MKTPKVPIYHRIDPDIDAKVREFAQRERRGIANAYEQVLLAGLKALTKKENN